jgi:hypothetical protein
MAKGRGKGNGEGGEQHSVELPQSALEGTGLTRAQVSVSTQSPEPIVLRTSHDVGLVHTALELRVDSLDKLAKKNTDEGYEREARVIANDAADIRHYVLPIFAGQRELDLIEPEALQEGLSSVIRTRLEHHRARKSIPNVVADDLAQRMTLLLDELATRAYSAGFAARHHEARLFAFGALAEVREKMVDELKGEG